MEMRASQVIKGALGGGAKRKKKKKEREIGGRNGETERRETPSNPHRWRGVETGMSQLFSNSSERCRLDLVGCKGQSHFRDVL